MTAPLVVLSAEQLSELIEAAVSRALARQQKQALPEHVSVREAALMYGGSERNIRRMVRAGRLRATRQALSGSSRLRILRSDVEKLIANSAV